MVVKVEENECLNIEKTDRRKELPEICLCKAEVFQSKSVCLLRVVLVKLLAPESKNQGQYHQPPNVRALVEPLSLARVCCFEAKLKHTSLKKRRVKVNVVKEG